MIEFELLKVLLLASGGLAAGMINTIAGSGSLISFPMLLALGYPPVLANVTNNIGVLPGSISGAVGYRHELRGQWRSLMPLIVCALLGGAAGALLLLVLPPEVFDGVVPALIAVACVLVIIGPWLKKRIAARQAARLSHEGVTEAEAGFRENKVALGVVTALTGTYGGYFGAAQGVILLSLLSTMLEGTIQRANAFKNMLAAAANFSAGIVFVMMTPIDWLAAAIIGGGAIIGGQLGARIGRRIPELPLRITILVVGAAAIVALLMN